MKKQINSTENGYTSPNDSHNEDFEDSTSISEEYNFGNNQKLEKTKLSNMDYPSDIYAEKELILPKNIKMEIKNGVTRLKELLKNENDLCINLIKLIVNDYALPRDVDGLVLDHYSNTIKECTSAFKSWPVEIMQLRDIVATLFNLTRGEGKLIYDTIAELELDYVPKTYDILARLCMDEIGVQFDPKVNYHFELDKTFWLQCTEYLSGQNVDSEF